MRIPLYQIDAFTGRVFSGNPAAVCPLDSWLDDATMLNIAAENNLSETAFFVREGDIFHLRWFTPLVEIDLCGHATLGSAFVLFNLMHYHGDRIEFRTQSGPLWVYRRGHHLVMDFPSREPIACDVPPNLIKALGIEPVEVLKSRDYFCVFESEEQIRAIDPDMNLLLTLDADVLITARGSQADFVSRYFAPLAGIPEDPATGSTHCNLIPYWAEALGKQELYAQQLSKRGGEIFCEMHGDRVRIAGEAVKYFEGFIDI